MKHEIPIAPLALHVSWLSVLLLVTGNSQLATAQTRPANSLEVRALVADLAHENWVRRDAAASALVDLGEEARPALERLFNTASDPDLRTRAEAILAALDRSRHTRPTLITLDYRDAPAKVVFDDLSRQAGIKLILPEDALPRITLKAQREPFWAVMTRLCPQAKLIPTPAPDHRAITLEAGDWHVQRSVVSGPLLILAGRASRSSSIDLGEADTPVRTLNLQLSVFADPALRVLAYSPVPLSLQAADGQGQEVETQNAEELELCPNSAGQPFVCELGIELVHPKARVRKLSRLSGTLLITVPQRVDTVEVDNIVRAAGISRIAGFQRFTISNCKTSGDKTDLTLTFQRGLFPRDQWEVFLSAEVLGQCVRLLDAEGRPLQFRSLVDPPNRDLDRGEASVTLSFIRPKDSSGKYTAGAPVKFVFEAVTELKTISVPFELKDLEMP